MITSKVQERSAPAVASTTIEVVEVETARRLVVLVPADLDNPADYASKINRLAVQYQRHVLYLSLCAWESDKLAAERQLATLEALTRGSGFNVRAVQAHVSAWAAALNGIAQPGDMVICLPEQAESAGVFRSLSLGQYIEERFHCQVHVLSGQKLQASFKLRAQLRGLLFWLGTLLILVGFSVLEYDASYYLAGVWKILSMLLLFLFETVLIFRWNRLTS